MSSDLFFQAVINGLMLSSIYALIALGLTIVFGLLDIVNFAHGQLLLLGAYLTYEVVDATGNYWLALPVALLVVGLVGAVADWTLFARVRETPINGLLVSLGLIAVFVNVFHEAYGPDPYRVPSPLTSVVEVGSVRVAASRLLVIGVAALTLVGLTLFLRRTRLGVALRATAENDEAAELMGIPVERVRHVSFATGAALAGVAGALMAAVYPIEPVVGDAPLIMGFAALILGGAGSPIGAVLGALVIGMAQSFGITYESSTFADIAVFSLLIIILFVRPRGLVRVSTDSTL